MTSWNYGQLFLVIRFFRYSSHGLQPAEVQKPQVLTGLRVTAIVQHDPPSTITRRCICEAGKDRTQGAR
jgi:hypothetical protein